MNLLRIAFLGVAVGCVGFGGAACGGKRAKSEIRIDGSSTVYPITMAVAEEFERSGGGRVTIGVSGTGGGFKKFCRGEIDVGGASRPIKPSELALCDKNGVEFIELPVAFDGIAVAVHKDADWVEAVTVSQLKTMWEPEAQGKIVRWNQVRHDWPDRSLHLFGPGVDSGTYDYFTKAIVGKEHASRGDFTSSEDDNVLVQGVSTDKSALGFFGYAYYAENQDKLKLLAVDDGDPANGNGPIRPTLESVANGTYQPLSRPIFIYVRKEAAEKNAAVAKFVEFYLGESGRKLIAEVRYIPLPDTSYELALRRFGQRTTGTVFGGSGSQVGVSVDQLLRSGS